MVDKLIISRFNKKTIVYGLLIIWLLSINVWLYNYKYSSNYIIDETSIYDQEYGSKAPEASTPIKFDALSDINMQNLAKKLGIKDKRRIDGHSTIYDDILGKHNLEHVLKNLDFQQRCDLYFKNLYAKDRNWFINPNEDLPLDHRHEFSFEDFKNNVMNGVKDKYAEITKTPAKDINFNDLQVTRVIEKLVEEEYNEFWQKTMDIEQKMVDYLSHLRIFNKCYVTSDNKYQIDLTNKLIHKESKSLSSSVFKPHKSEELIKADNFASCSELEGRIYRWLSMSNPIYERWTGEVFFEPPRMDKFVKYPEVFESSSPKHTERLKAPEKAGKQLGKACFLNQFKNSLNGKGIVLSIKDSHVTDTVNFIHLLRALNNHYPIQIVFYDSLSDESKGRIVNAARNKMADLPESFKKVADNFPKSYFNNKDGGLPKQEVWFVNSYNAIHNNFKDKFRSYGNKFLATLFNSFEEFMLVDADTVLVKNPEYFFNLKNYKSKGAYFFKDRTAPLFRPESDLRFFEKMTPSLFDNFFFDIPIITKHTLGLEFFQRMGHQMESGAVLINRARHFNSVLTMIQMNFFHPVTTRVYGDKEIFWLGFAVDGDEDYHFNKLAAASIGTLTPTSERLNSDGKPKISKEICSAHPAHLNGEDNKSLLWFNSGYKYCGQSDVIDFDEEVKKQKKLTFLKDSKTMKQHYEDPVIIKNAIIPPFKNGAETWVENVIDEPKQGWHMNSDYCNSYLWCAYSSIGGLTADGQDNTQIGQVFEFDQKSIDLFQYYGDIWVGNE